MREQNVSAETSVGRFQNLRIGDRFTDHAGRKVHKISETEVSFGVGYNNVMKIAEYIQAVWNGEEYARHVLPGFNADWHHAFSHA